jgi:hypothetical protein
VARKEYVRRWAGTGTDPKPGYPKIVQFQTMEEVEAYLNQDRIDCLLCGRRYKMLNSHVGRMHQMDLREYKIKCGLPLTSGLISASTRERLVELGYKQIEGLTPEEVTARMHKAKAAQTGPPADQIHGSPAILNMRRANLKAAADAGAHISLRTAKIPWKCVDCGADVMVGEVFAITNPCRVYCKRCRQLHHLASQEKWAAKKGIDIKEWRKEVQRRSAQRKKERKQK